MKTLITAILGVGLLLCPFSNTNADNQFDHKNLIKNKLVFEENRGQIADSHGNPVNEVLFRARGKNMQIFFFKNKISYQFEVYESKDEAQISEATGEQVCDPLKSLEQKETFVKTHRIDFEWQGSNDDVQVIGESKNSDYANYYQAHCPEGLTGVPNFNKLVYKNLYQGIDVVFYKNDEGLKYDYHVDAGADPSQIKWAYEGMDGLELSALGHIEMESSLGFLKEMRPLVKYEQSECYENYSQKGNTFEFNLESKNSEAMIIDPQVIWGTYFGGDLIDNYNVAGVEANNLAVDNNAIYITFSTISTNLGATGHQTTLGGNYDSYVAKFSLDGIPKWHTYYGGTDAEDSRAIDVKDSIIYFAGSTFSTNAISFMGHQNNYGGVLDAFLVKLDSSGQRKWATYYGGSNTDRIIGMSIGQNNEVWVSGHTHSSGGIALNGYQNIFGGGRDAFLSCFSSTGTLTIGTYYGGTDQENSFSLEYYDSTTIYLSGLSASTSGIASGNGYQTTIGGTTDAFIVSFDRNLNRNWATYFGGPSSDWIIDLDIDDLGNLFFCGRTTSTNGIYVNGFQNSLGGGTDAMFGKFLKNGLLSWSSYYGGSNSDHATEIEYDSNYGLYLCGVTNSFNNIHFNGKYNTKIGQTDVFVARFDTGGVNREWGSYYGGSLADDQADIKVLGDKIILTGATSSPDINFKNGYDLTHNNQIDIFLTNDVLPCQGYTGGEILDEGGVWNPPYGLNFSTSGTGIGTPLSRPGGITYHIDTVLLADTTDVYYAADPDTFFLSFRGYTTPMEFMKYRPDLSDPCQGMSRWRGETRFSTSPGIPVYTRFTMTATNRNTGFPVELIQPDSSGLPFDIGAMFKVESDSAYDVNLIFEASYDSLTGWTAALDFFDTETNGPIHSGLALSSYAGSYYWVNAKPNVDVNNGMMVMEGATDTLNNSELSFSDLESPADSTYLYIAPGGASQLPNYGTLKLSGTNISPNTQIIQSDINLGRISYVHSGTEEATDTMYFSVVDSKGAYEKVNGDSIIPFVFYIQPINDDPVLVYNNGITVNEGDTAIIDSTAVYFTDIDSNTDSLSYTLLMGLAGLPNHGDLQLNGVTLNPSSSFTQDEVINGNFRYIHDGTPNFLDTFNFYLQDDSLAYAQVNGDSIFPFIITINPVNDPPFLAINSPLVLNEGANALIQNNKLFSTDEESPNDSIYYEYAANGSGTLQFGNLRLNGIPMNPNDVFTQQDIDSSRVRYFHDGSEYPIDNFVFMVTDPEGDTASDNGFTLFNFGIAIIPVNDVPVGLDTTFVMPGGTTLSDSLSVFDPDDTVFIYTQVVGPFNGSINAFNSNTGAFTYQPNLSFLGMDSMHYTVQDQQGAIDTALVVFDVQNVAPVALQDSIYTDENIVISDTLEGIDINQQALTFAISSPPAKGSVNITNANSGEFTYTPNPGAIGFDHFLFTADDGSLISNPDSVLIHIRPNIDPGDLVFSVRNAIAVMDPNTLEVGIYSSGGLITNSQGLAFEPNGDLLAIDATNGILRIDNATGSQTILTPDTFFAPGNPGQIDLDVSSTGEIYITDGGGGRVYEINPLTGDTSTLAVGASLTFPTAIKVAMDGSLLVADAGFFASDTSHIIRIDPNTGNQSIISSNDSLAISIGLAEDYNGQLLVSDAKSVIGGQDQIIRIDTSTGQQVIINADPQLDFTSAIGIQRQNGEIYIVSSNNNSIYKLDRFTNTLTLMGQDGLIDEPFGLTVIQIPNSPPTLVNSIPDTAVHENSNLIFAINPSTFNDPDPVDTLTYSAQLMGGGNLPAWLSFDQNTVTFSGTPAINDTGTVSIEVIASDNLNQSAQDDFNILVYTTVGLTDEQLATLVIFPNPANDYVFVKSAEINGDIIIEITDLKGNQIEKFERLNTERLEEKIDVSGFSSGAYFISIGNENYQIKRKVIIE